jgi:hypothetical protein
MPSSRQARWTRSAISPRLAIRILPKSWFGFLATIGDDGGRRGGKSGYHDQRLSELDRLPFSASTCFTTPTCPDSISFISFIASMMQSVSPTCTVSPTSTNGFRPATPHDRTSRPSGFSPDGPSASTGAAGGARERRRGRVALPASAVGTTRVDHRVAHDGAGDAYALLAFFDLELRNSGALDQLDQGL